MPGLINSHTHAAMTCFRGIADDIELMDWLNNYIFPAEAKNVNIELAFWGSLLACAEMIKSGTTTFCDMYIFEDETAKAAKKAGMRCLLGEVLFDFPSPNVKTPAEGLEYTRMLIEKWAGDPLVNIMVEPHSLYTCSPSLLIDAKALADQYNIPLATHFLENKGEAKQLRKKLGKRATHFLKDINYLDERFFAFHCVCMDEEDIKIFADSGCKAVHNPESNMKLASGVAPISSMLDHGIVVGLGTDGCASNNMATCNGARVLGMENLAGSLKAGMKADIITIDLNRPHLTPMYNPYSHLVYAVNGSDVNTVIINGKIVMKDRRNGSDVNTVIINGKIVMKDRRLLTINESEVMKRVNKIALGIKKSLGIEPSCGG
jgi:5-methylthioadenosine/S-adenosylhomocysteine deaminase